MNTLESKPENILFIEIKHLEKIDNAVNAVNLYYKEAETVVVDTKYLDKGIELIEDNVNMLIILENSIRNYDINQRIKNTKKLYTDNMEHTTIPEKVITSIIEYNTNNLNPLSFICIMLIAMLGIRKYSLDILNMNSELILKSGMCDYKSMSNLKNSIYFFRKILAVKSTGMPFDNNKFIHLKNSTIH